MCIFISRFENTVTAVFNGHTHNDHFHVYYATNEPTHPISVAINGGSVTPFSDLNSNYKTYSVDSATFVSIWDEERTQIQWTPNYLSDDYPVFDLSMYDFSYINMDMCELGFWHLSAPYNLLWKRTESRVGFEIYKRYCKTIHFFTALR
jgi:hypothetical protein